MRQRRHEAHDDEAVGRGEEREEEEGGEERGERGAAGEHEEKK